ncbi:hypothetical protein PVK06_020313 [Gossypium arboreum]|uniref:Uncharacterized protein n=1 Tax=Gossypium arboreum TaxID=29729 RepID=A0ABR0PMH6_GOSAR|nr:hypothetical protein PVK06_020313 [Gossypium arboreum]
MPVGKALGLSSSTSSAEAKEAENEKKPVECFLCYGLHRLRKCLRNSIIERDDGANRKPKKLGLSKRKVEAKRAKKSKKKRQSKSVVVKEKTTSELVESSKWLPHKKDVSLSSNLGEKVAMKTVKLGPMRLNSSKAIEVDELSARLSLMEEVSLASNSEKEFVMQTLKLGSMRLISIDKPEGLSPMREVECASNFGKVVIVLRSNLLTWQERKGPFEVLEQGGRETVDKAKPSIVNQEDFVRGKLECRQESCHPNVQTSGTVRFKKRCKLRQKFRRKEKANASKRDQGESSQWSSEVATTTL